MCGACEADEVEPLREVYLARRARIARTWTPPGGKRRWAADAVAPAASPIITAEPLPTAFD
jgi:hypothetical protein